MSGLIAFGAGGDEPYALLLGGGGGGRLALRRVGDVDGGGRHEHPDNDRDDNGRDREGAGDATRARPNRGAEEREFQSEKVVNHSRPSTA